MKRMLLFLFAAISSLIGCKPRTGIVSGNAYWKYNNYVGDKPDAGSSVYLFSKDSSEAPLTTTCDVQGNFKLDKVPAGLYIIVIRSNHTTSNGYETYEQMRLNPLQSFFGFDIETVNKEIKDSISKYNQLYAESYDNRKRTDIKSRLGYLKATADYEAKRNKYADSLLRIIKPNRLTQHMIMPGMYGPKVKIDMIDVDEEKPINKVADFGVTYM